MQRPACHPTLGQVLDHVPYPLGFGTSGRRGLVVHLSQLEIFINVVAELEYLKTLPVAEGGIKVGDPFFFAADLRPSSVRYMPEYQGRGELAQAVMRAIESAGLSPVYLGHLPTPALAAFAFSQRKGSIMVTGSHIPFDRNGYKLNTARGELLKQQEAPISQWVERVRTRVYAEAYPRSIFDRSGRLKHGSVALPVPQMVAVQAYIRRFVDFFGDAALRGLRLLVYQHSAVGREVLPAILRALGADVRVAGWSDTFVPIDTENIDAERLATLQRWADEVRVSEGPVDVLVSTDGDSDRPLVVDVEPGTGAVRFLPGDILGMVTAAYLGADAVVVPVSCNDAIDRGPLASILEPKTRIGSPYVIAGMEAARARGKRVVCGWEPNGGFLTATPIHRQGHTLAALPTRDAVLPIVTSLVAAREHGLTLSELVDRLPARFSGAGLIKNFPRRLSDRIVSSLSPAHLGLKVVMFGADGSVCAYSEDGNAVPLDEPIVAHMVDIRNRLVAYFEAGAGFADITHINYVDGPRISFAHGDVVHLRPSGNADEIRVYAVSNSQARADAVVAHMIAEPDGVIHRLADGLS